MNESGVDEPLVDPTVLHAPQTVEDNVPTRAEPINVFAVTFRWKIATFALAVISLCLLAYTGRTEYLTRTTILPESAIRRSDAVAVNRLGNYSSRCSTPWEFACGRYASSSLRANSVFREAQERVDVELASILKGLPDTSQPKAFFKKCSSAENPTAFLRSNFTWWWDRGLEAAGLSFGRVRSSNSRFRLLAVKLSRSAGGSSDDECVNVPVDSCEGRFAKYASRGGHLSSFDTEICILGGSVERVCTHLVAALSNSNLSNTSSGQGSFSNSETFCIQETKRLWPQETSMAWESHMNSDEIDAITSDIFVRAQASIVSRLSEQNQKKLMKAVSMVKLNQHYQGPPEVYRAGLSAANAFDWWEELLLEKEQFDRSRLYFSSGDWDMPSHTINAYYWPEANAVFVTQAIRRWMAYGASDSEQAGRLGFLLGHELGHAIHSNVEGINDAAAHAAYNAGKMCLTEEFGGSDLTTHEDMADRVGYGVVGALLSELPVRRATYCAVDTCFEASERHIAFLAAAQPFCATKANSEKTDSFDPHSSNDERVRHSLKGTAAAADAWDCNIPSAVSMCTIIGAPVTY